jgi:hypothetical protein
MTLDDIPEYAKATDLQRAYCHQLAACGIKAKAARAAGYSEESAGNMGARLSQKEWVCKAVECIREELNGQTGTDPATVRAELWANHKAAQGLKNWAASNRALELLGKANGLFVDKLEVTGKDGVPLAGEQLTDIELARKLAFAIRLGAESEVKQDTGAAESVSGDCEPPDTQPGLPISH